MIERRKGTRIYSVPEIKAMICKAKMTEDWLLVYESLPDNIKNIISNISSTLEKEYQFEILDEKRLIELANIYSDEVVEEDTQEDVNTVDDFDEEDEFIGYSYGDMMDFIEEDIEKEDLVILDEVTYEDAIADDINLSEDNIFDDINQSQEDNPYSELVFEGLLNITKLYVYEKTGDSCNIHNNLYKVINAKITYDGWRKYGLSLNCCDVCKRLYMNKDDFEKVKTTLQIKNIEYKWFHGGNAYEEKGFCST